MNPGPSNPTAAGETFPKEERLVKTKDFRRVYREGSSFKKDDVVLYRLPNGASRNRVGFVARFHNIKLATRRNRLKRLFREAYRKSRKGLRKGFDIVILVKKDLGKKASYRNAEAILLELAKKAGLLA